MVYTPEEIRIKTCIEELERAKKKIEDVLSNNLPFGSLEWLAYGIESECIVPSDIPEGLREDSIDIVENLVREDELVKQKRRYVDTTLAVKHPDIIKNFNIDIERILRSTLKSINEILEEF